MVELIIQSGVVDLAAGVVEASGIRIAATDERLRQLCQQAAAEVIAGGSAGGEPRRQAVRDLLRRGGYKPSGRSKPAQEYLLRTVHEAGELPSISNAVDLINLVSLQSGLPISLLALDRIGTRLVLRYGGPGERYVFNRAGQELDLQGLLCVCAADDAGGPPFGSPVKDSLVGKVQESDGHLLACIFAAQSEITSCELQEWAQRLADGFREFCGASAAAVQVQPAAWDR